MEPGVCSPGTTGCCSLYAVIPDKRAPLMKSWHPGRAWGSRCLLLEVVGVASEKLEKYHAKSWNRKSRGAQ